MFNWIKSRLVPEAKVWWRLGSVRLAALGGGLVAAIVANPDIFFSMIAVLPSGGARYVVSAAIGFVAFALPTLTRLWSEWRLPKIEDLIDDK